MTGIEARLAALEDREAIRDLIASYGPFVDRGNAIGAAALWVEDGIYDIGSHGTYRGRVAITALLGSAEHMALIAEGAAHR